MFRLAADSGLDLYSFQTGPRVADIAEARATRLVEDLSGKIDGHWPTTASWLTQIDVL
jgi:hypothetical protein